MLASRFWYGVLAIIIGVLSAGLFMAASMFDRAAMRSMNEGLAADVQVVSWYLRDDSRKRSSALVQFALDEDLAKALAKSSAAPDKVPADARDKAKKILATVSEKLPKDLGFSALFAVDQNGRVVAQLGFDQAGGNDDFELGGYAVVADALHGWVRDDAWVLDGRIYRIVARPVEGDTSQMPAGAIVGARIVDDGFALELSKRTGAAITFYAHGTSYTSAAPEGFDKGQLDATIGDLVSAQQDPKYMKEGHTDLRVLHDNLAVVYSKIPGESWDLGAGFAVGRAAQLVRGPAGFFKAGDDSDKKAINFPIVIGVAFGAVLLGLLFTILEYSRPLAVFRREAERLAKGETDQMTPSTFRGVFRKIASDLNDGMERAAVKGGGGSRKAADLESVLGPIPAQPAMSAFSFPGDGQSSGFMPVPSPISIGGPASAPATPRVEPSKATIAAAKPPPPARPAPPAAPPPSSPPAPPAARKPPPPRAATPTPPTTAAPPAAAKADAPPGEAPTMVQKISDDLLAVARGEVDGDDWPQVYEEFVACKKANNEPIEALTFDKFRATLRRHRDAIVEKQGTTRVKFTVYTKDGRAALKATPVKG